MGSVLVTGASGSLGHAVADRLADTWTVLAGWHGVRPGLENCREVVLDLSSPGEVKEVIERMKPDAVVHCAAWTDPELCKKDPEGTLRVNAEGTREIAEAVRRIKGRLVYISTDLVFDGSRSLFTEEDEPNPLNEYARSKYLGEIAVRESIGNYLILRISVMYGFGSGRKGTFSDWLIGNLERGSSVRLFQDQYRTSFYLPDGGRLIEKLLNTDFTGLFHAGGDERLSRYEFGLAVARRFGLPEDLIVPSKMADLPDYARRPADCSLATTKLKRVVGFSPTPLEEALKEMEETFSRRKRTCP